MAAPPTGCFVGGAFVEGGAPFPVDDKFSGETLASVASASPALIEQALDAASRYAPPPAWQRAETLIALRDAVTARREDFRRTLTAEAGFPIRDANGEIDRTLQTLALCAEEAKRIGGETIPFDGAPTGTGRMGFTFRVPVGTIVAITPFNAPLNTVCHKLGPAFAAGNAAILKPSDKTPLTANLLAECFAEADAPAGSLAVLHGGAEIAQALIADPRPAFFAFTGSTAAGAAIQRAAGLRRTQMELGSIAATIVLADADIEAAALKCAGASFRKAGQVCTSIQMLMVERDAQDAFTEAFLGHARAFRTGDPADPDTDIGPMISVAAAERVEAMLAGANLLLGGARERALLPPTVAFDPPADSPLLGEEIFGPVTCLIPVDGLEQAIDRVNATPFGLATGLFTRRIDAAFRAARRLDVGAVHVNETCSSRVDLMPYGGVKASGFGREGPKYAVREMTEERLVTFSGLA